jgi:putative transposase
LTKQVFDDNKINPEEKIMFPSAINLHKCLVAMVEADNSLPIQTTARV